jgi:hypothetical protein
MLEKLARPVLITSEADNEWHEPQEHPEVEVEVEQEGEDSSSGNNSEIDASWSIVNDFKNNSDLDINQTKRRKVWESTTCHATSATSFTSRFYWNPQLHASTSTFWWVSSNEIDTAASTSRRGRGSAES